jgi:hypothetical protein
MPLKVKFRGKGKRGNIEQAYDLALLQPRRDAKGNRIQGKTYEEIAAMTPVERRHFADGVWLHQQRLKTKNRREA